jgi:hypothetical protein
MAELCRVLGISRKTYYRIVDLYLAAIKPGDLVYTPTGRFPRG